MSYAGKKQGVISGSMIFNGKEYVEIFDHQHKYLYGEVDDLIAYGAWVEYDVVDAPANHPKNCQRMAKNINQDVKQSRAPTTDEFGKTPMSVREFNKVDFFHYQPEGGQLTHKSTITRDFSTDSYYNTYYGEVIMARDSRNRLIEHQINTLDVMLNLIPSERYEKGPHWEVTHFINQGKQYSINGYLSIRGYVLPGPDGVVRNRRDVVIPPASAAAAAPTTTASWDEQIEAEHQKKDSEATSNPPSGLGSFGAVSGFGAAAFRASVNKAETPATKSQGFGFGNVAAPEKEQEKPVEVAQTRGFGNLAAPEKEKPVEVAQPRKTQVGVSRLAIVFAMLMADDGGAGAPITAADKRRMFQRNNDPLDTQQSRESEKLESTSNHASQESTASTVVDNNANSSTRVRDPSNSSDGEVSSGTSWLSLIGTSVAAVAIIVCGGLLFKRLLKK